MKTIDEFRDAMIKHECLKYSQFLVESTFKHYSDTEVDLRHKAHQEMLSMLNDDEEISKLYLKYIQLKS